MKKPKTSGMEDGKKGCGGSQFPLDQVVEKGERKMKKHGFRKAFLFFISKLCPFPLFQSMLFLALLLFMLLFPGRGNEGTEAAQV